MSREVFEKMHAVLPCTPVIDSCGQLVCSLMGAAGDVIGFFQPGLQANWAVQLDAVAKGQPDERAKGFFL